MTTTGKILRFDEFRGYGFIAPDDGGEDVFMHANDLLDEKHLFQPGSKVRFVPEYGDKGPKASEVRVVERAAPTPVVRPSAGPDGDDTMCDVLSVTEFRQELTEALVEVGGSLTADQIKQVRRRVIEIAQAHNWIES
ncbi:cold shock domain-containing protein [Streptomyces sp. 110]|uniref:Cold shock domain-containing protein n=1 Tax=Streptomyces endocoffeicus TaxID=2898945 RepID=A0ABS1PY13_9ACTN|nr:cold shock domain-containing protein [Streptomyces endocoffeicus]MBL1117303.1 cold shock domain-containing protein [Streptomyces endocoffeicus]